MSCKYSVISYAEQGFLQKLNLILGIKKKLRYVPIQIDIQKKTIVIFF